MNQTPNCPSRQDLKQFLLGQSENDAAVKVEQHVTECPVCVATLHGLNESDTIVEAVRRGAADSTPRLPEPDARLVGKLCQLFPAASSSGSSPEATADFAADRGAADTPSQTGPTAGGEVAQEVLSVLAPPLLPGEIGRLGPYRVLKILGAGGMGVVFQAEDPHLKRLVALKVMKPTLAAIDAARKRFVREAQATAAIEHDHIVGIYQVAEDRGVPFIAMQFLRGESLEDRLKRERKLPLDESLRIAREIADGLAAAHEQGLMHRDIKPANVWLEHRSRHAPRDESGTPQRSESLQQSVSINPSRTQRRLPHAEREGYGGRVKLLDFGLARAADDQQHLTQSGAIAGTPAYMAPEQAQGEAVDHRCDLFSLGCVLYRMLTGEQPFHGNNTMAVLLAITQQTPKPVRELNPEVPEGVEKLVSRLLEKDPAKRLAPATKVIELIATIEQKLAELPAKPITHQSPKRERGSAQPTPLPAVEPGVARPESAKGVEPSVGSPPRPSQTQGVPHRPPARRRTGWLLAAAAAAAIVLAGVVIRITTGEGTIEIEVNEPDVTVKVDGKEHPTIEINSPRDRITLRVRPGKHTLEVSKDGFKADVQKFEITRNGTTELSARLLPKDSPVATVSRDSAADPDRRAADWVLSIGGEIHINGQEQVIHAAAELSKDPFRLTNVDFQTNHQLTDAGLAYFKDCKNLTSLHLGGTQVTDAGLAHFKDCNKLTYLALNPTRVSDAGLAHFKDCKNLTILMLHQTQVTDAGLAHFKDCKNLEELYLSFTQVSDAGLVHFKDFKSLTNLDLTGTQVSDAGLAHFTGCPKLGSVRITKTKVTEAGVKQLSASLPGCKIEWDGGVIEPTAVALVPPLGASPLAALRREAIARYELAAAGFGDVAKAPAELVAVLGDSRLKHWAEVRDVENSPDGRRIATASSDGTLKIWDAENADQQLVLRGHAAAVISLKWNRDGSTLASGSHDQTLKLWDAATGNERLSIRLDTEHPHGAFDRDKRRLVGGGPKARIFDAATGDVLHTFEHNNVRLVAWSHDGTRIATGSDADRTIKIWDSATLDELRSLPFGRGTIRSLAFSPNDELLVAGADGGPAMWQVADGVERKIFDGVPGENWGVAFSRDGEQFALSSSFRKPIRRWNAKTWEPTGQIETNDHIWGLDFSGDGKTLAVAESAGFLRLIDAGTGQPRESPDAISGIALTPDGRTLGTISGEATVKLWDTATGQPTRTLAEHSAPLTSLAISPDGETIVAGSMDNTVRMWRVADGGASVTLGGHADAVMNVAISRDGQLLASGSSDKTVRIWELKTRKVRHTLTGFSHSVVRVAFSPDTRLLATASYPTPYSHQPVPEIRLWDVSTGKELGKLAEHTHWVTALTFTEDSQRLAAASMDGTVRIYDVADGKPGKALLVLDKHPNWVFSITFSPDGATLVSGGGDGTLRLWSTADGSLRREIPIGPTGGHRQLAGGGLINGILFAPDGNHVLTLNGNRTVYVLRLAAPADADR